MAIAAYFHPQSLTALQYDEAIRELEAAGAANPAGRVHHSCFGPDNGLMVYEVWESQLIRGPALRRSRDRPWARAQLRACSRVPRARDRTVTRSWAPVLAKIDLR